MRTTRSRSTPRSGCRSGAFWLTAAFAVAAAVGSVAANAQAQAAATASTPGVGTQPASPTRPAYYVAEFELVDPEGVKPYREQFDATLVPYGGRWVVRTGEFMPLEGRAPTRRLVVVAFDSLDMARAWYDSPA